MNKTILYLMFLLLGKTMILADYVQTPKDLKIKCREFSIKNEPLTDEEYLNKKNIFLNKTMSKIVNNKSLSDYTRFEMFNALSHFCQYHYGTRNKHDELKLRVQKFAVDYMESKKIVSRHALYLLVNYHWAKKGGGAKSLENLIDLYSSFNKIYSNKNKTFLYQVATPLTGKAKQERESLSKLINNQNLILYKGFIHRFSSLENGSRIRDFLITNRGKIHEASEQIAKDMTDLVTNNTSGIKSKKQISSPLSIKLGDVIDKQQAIEESFTLKEFTELIESNAHYINNDRQNEENVAIYALLFKKGLIYGTAFTTNITNSQKNWLKSIVKEVKDYDELNVRLTTSILKMLSSANFTIFSEKDILRFIEKSFGSDFGYSTYNRSNKSKAIGLISAHFNKIRLNSTYNNWSLVAKEKEKHNQFVKAWQMKKRKMLNESLNNDAKIVQKIRENVLTEDIFKKLVKLDTTKDIKSLKQEASLIVTLYTRVRPQIKDEDILLRLDSEISKLRQLLDVK